MEKCHEYFECKEIECIVFQNKNKQPCWKTERTLCFYKPLIPIVKESSKKERCDFCLYKMSILGNK